MDTELTKLLERLCDLHDDDLIKIVNHNRGDYRSEVIVFARVILVRRGFSVNKKGKILGRKQGKVQSRPAQQSQVDASSLNRGLIQVECPRCKATLEYAGTRRLHEDKSLSVLSELGEMYKKGASEFLDVYICRKCGRAELFVDGIGEELRPQ
jgi:hypothetical protein